MGIDDSTTLWNKEVNLTTTNGMHYKSCWILLHFYSVYYICRIWVTSINEMIQVWVLDTIDVNSDNQVCQYWCCLVSINIILWLYLIWRIIQIQIQIKIIINTIENEKAENQSIGNIFYLSTKINIILYIWNSFQTIVYNVDMDHCIVERETHAVKRKCLKYLMAEMRAINHVLCIYRIFGFFWINLDIRLTWFINIII